MIMRGEKTHTMGGRVEKGDACGKKDFWGWPLTQWMIQPKTVPDLGLLWPPRIIPFVPSPMPL